MAFLRLLGVLNGMVVEFSRVANLIGVGEATISRGETGAQIQQRALDCFLRLCLASPAAVELLRNDFQPAAKGA